MSPLLSPPTQLCDLCQLQVERSFLASDGTSVVRVGQPSDPQIKAAATAQQGPGSGGPDPSIPSPTQRSASGNPQLRETLGDSKKWGPVWPQDSRLSGGYPCPPLPAPAPPPAPLQGVQFQGLPETQPPAGRPPLLAKALEQMLALPESSPRRPGRAAPLRGHPVEPNVPLPRTQGWLLGARLLGPTRPPDQQEEGSRGRCPGGRQPPRGCGERRNRADDTRPCGGRAAGGVAVVPTSKHRYLFFFFFLVSGSSLGLGTEMSEELRPG